MLRKLITLALLIVGASAYGQTNWTIVSMRDGNSIYTNGARVASLAVDQITISTNWGWEDLRFPAGVAAPVTPNADVDVNESNNSITFETGCSTNRTADDHIYGVAQMPHTWRVGSEIIPHVHFEQTAANQTNCWYMYYRLQPMGTNIVTAWTFTGPASNHFAYVSGTLHQMANFGRINMTGMQESSIMDWKIFRLGSAGTGNIEFKEFDIHYQIEKPTGQQF